MYSQISSTTKMFLSMFDVATSYLHNNGQISSKSTEKISRLLDKFDFIRELAFDAYKLNYKDHLTHNYTLLKSSYERTSNTVDYVSEEVGKYLVRSRSDIVNQNPDGKIQVKSMTE